MKLGIDIETYSDVNLVKAGVYAYADSPAFEILLFSYAFDDEEIEVVDIASGEKLPDRVMMALTDNSIIKTAFNAAFERTCIGKYYGLSLDPAGWQCTAVQSAMLALPHALDDVGEVLSISHKKLKEGKDLLRYFSMPCKPTKANGGRRRNRPEDAPEKWEQFKKYCIRDVEAEREIRRKIAKFPIPEEEQKLYQMDQEINDRGILVDMELVEHAVTCDNEYREAVTKRAYELTGLENPNSPAQIKGWLSEHGVEMESLSKKAVGDMISEADGEVLEVLKLRLLMAKTSVKKYEAIKRSVCSDKRVHGLLQFYGANRTGRWCLTGDHEILTPGGWVRLDEFHGGLMMCWNQATEVLSFQNAKQLAFPYTGEMITYEGQRISQIATPDHKMATLSKEGYWESRTVADIGEHRFTIPFTGHRAYQIKPSDAEELRVLIMTQADGHYTVDGSLRFHFSKKRKVERCKHLLRQCDICFVTSNNNDGTITVTIKSAFIPLWLRAFNKKTFDYWMLDEPLEVMFDEIPLWDGCYTAKNSIQYSTTNRKNADVVQACALCAGFSATQNVKRRDKWSDTYVVNIWLRPGHGTSIRREQVKKVDYDGTVYCAETPTGFFPVRREGRIWITGNSGRLVQVQNLPQNHIPDLALARDLIKASDYETLDMLYDSTPGVLSELIRTTFIPKPGCRFIVSDFSAIEARVLAWLSGEKWRLDTFEAGGDIYCASASKMFGVPVEKHGINVHLRQKGKIAELALGYGGSVGALTSMGALDMGLKEEELPPLVQQWRTANPHITKFWYGIDAAAVKAVKKKTTVPHGNLEFSYKSGILFITLPSGRKLSYIKPRMIINKFGREALSYEGVGDAKKWMRIETYGAKITENIVQATARDLLAQAMLRLTDAGFDIVMHIHDEAVVEVPDGRSSVNEICSIMAEAPEWAKGLPLNADGYECEFYQKD
ncbi:MAG: DNA polymerase [Anaerovoracaceae bacterium]|jgi:hypothetical protein